MHGLDWSQGESLLHCHHGEKNGLPTVESHAENIFFQSIWERVLILMYVSLQCVYYHYANMFIIEVDQLWMDVRLSCASNLIYANKDLWMCVWVVHHHALSDSRPMSGSSKECSSITILHSQGNQSLWPSSIDANKKTHAILNKYPKEMLSCRMLGSFHFLFQHHSLCGDLDVNWT